MKKLLSLFTLLFVTAISFAQDIVTVSPTYKEAVHYTNLTGQGFWNIVALVILAAMVVYVILVATNRLIFRVWILFLGAIFSLAAWRAKPTACWLNNDKHVERSYLEKVGRDYILDSCFKNNLMQNAAVK